MKRGRYRAAAWRSLKSWRREWWRNAHGLAYLAARAVAILEDDLGVLDGR